MLKQTFLERFHHARCVTPVADFPLRSPGRPAAVLIPIVDRHTHLTMLFTQRAHHLKHHAGQISFPGGKQEAQDATLLDTALRETYEEIGLDANPIQILGSLPSYRTISRYQVRPYVGLVTPPFDLQLDDNEVAEIFEVPLDFLLDKNNHLIHWVERPHSRHPVYFIPWQTRNIWGATAAFVRTLSDHLYTAD